jgi:hypothetical protein
VLRTSGGLGSRGGALGLEHHAVVDPLVALPGRRLDLLARLSRCASSLDLGGAAFGRGERARRPSRTLGAPGAVAALAAARPRATARPLDAGVLTRIATA